MFRDDAARPSGAVPIWAQKYLAAAALGAAKTAFQSRQVDIAEFCLQGAGRHHFVMTAPLAPNPNIQPPRHQPAEPYRLRGRRRSHETPNTKRTKHKHYNQDKLRRNHCLHRRRRCGKQLAPFCCRSSGVEHSLGKGEVGGSIPLGSTIFPHTHYRPYI